MPDAIEITTFELNGCSVKEFVAANAEVDAWLKRQPGFRSRAIAVMPDGSITDVLRWESVQAGKDGASRLMVELADARVHGLIKQDSVSWNVVPVVREA
jgi:hypothetical protein